MADLPTPPSRNHARELLDDVRRDEGWIGLRPGMILVELLGRIHGDDSTERPDQPVRGEVLIGAIERLLRVSSSDTVESRTVKTGGASSDPIHDDVDKASREASVPLNEATARQLAHIVGLSREQCDWDDEQPALSQALYALLWAVQLITNLLPNAQQEVRHAGEELLRRCVDSVNAIWRGQNPIGADLVGQDMPRKGKAGRPQREDMALVDDLARVLLQQDGISADQAATLLSELLRVPKKPLRSAIDRLLKREPELNR